MLCSLQLTRLGRMDQVLVVHLGESFVQTQRWRRNERRVNNRVEDGLDSKIGARTPRRPLNGARTAKGRGHALERGPEVAQRDPAPAGDIECERHLVDALDRGDKKRNSVEDMEEAPNLGTVRVRLNGARSVALMNPVDDDMRAHGDGLKAVRVP
eukprot:Amastigsp_a842606_27.p2 type:complete len:155 gc:universal Amastigsp_a842606_27:141-605(+)